VQPLSAAGMRPRLPKSDLKIGATYTFEIAPPQNGSNLGLLRVVTLPDGRVIRKGVPPESLERIQSRARK
jgi:hypothetical protein